MSREEQRASHKLGYGSKLFVKVGQTIERGDKLFEWDPYTLPIIAEKSGTAKHVDLVMGSLCAKRLMMPLV